MTHAAPTLNFSENVPFILREESTDAPQGACCLPKTLCDGVNRLWVNCLCFIDVNSQWLIGRIFRQAALGDSVIFQTGNHGKKSDVSLYEKGLEIPKFSEIAMTRGFTVSNHISLKPFGFHGACLGSSLFFSKEWLLTGDLNHLSKKFEGGAPYEAIALQGCLTALPNKYKRLYFQPLYDCLNQMFAQLFGNAKIGSVAEAQAVLEGLKKEWSENPYISDCEKCKYILEASECFLVEKREINEFRQYVQGYLKKNYDYSLEVGLLYNAVNQIALDHGSDYGIDQMKQDMILHQYKTIGNLLDLEITSKMFASSPSQVLSSQISDWDTGIYCCAVPVYSSFGSHSGMHAFVLVKANHEHFYLFDPNFGAKEIQADPTSALTKQYQFYCGDFLIEEPQTLKDKISRVFLRVKNILFFESSAPLFKPTIDRFEVCQIRLA